MYSASLVLSPVLILQAPNTEVIRPDMRLVSYPSTVGLMMLVTTTGCYQSQV